MQRGMKNDILLIIISPKKVNPYAIGHLINHLPPNNPANIKLVDFDIPIIFSPKYMRKNFPIIKRLDDHAFT